MKSVYYLWFVENNCHSASVLLSSEFQDFSLMLARRLALATHALFNDCPLLIEDGATGRQLILVQKSGTV